MEDWRGMTFSMHEGDEKHKILLQNPLEKRPGVNRRIIFRWVGIGCSRLIWLSLQCDLLKVA